MNTKQTVSDLFSLDNLPEELRTLTGDVRNRATATADSLMQQGFKVPVAVSMTTERVRHWSGLDSGPYAHHVIPHPNGWAVMKADAERPSVVTSTKEDAVARGREIARNQQGKLVIHGEDGMVQDEHTYVNA